MSNDGSEPQLDVDDPAEDASPATKSTAASLNGAETASPARSASGSKTSAVAPVPVVKRRKRASERALQIIYLLESKYEILPKVCSSFENWKEAPSGNYDIDLLWSDVAISAERFMKLRLYQKMNHFVGMSSITRKGNLARNLSRMKKQYPNDYKFFPDTWILPGDSSDFKQQFSLSKGKPTFIVKPDNGCQGKGIFLIRDAEKTPTDTNITYVAQRYLSKPFLLDGYKFDLRLYVLVVGCDPLRILLHRRGLVRLASKPYAEPTGKNLSQMMVHLTNYAINKMNPNFEENTNPDDAQDGHKRSWEAVQHYLQKEGHNVEALKAEIEDLIIKTLIAVQPTLSHFYHSCQPEDVDNGMCFEVLGFDVIIDEKLQPWLLEVNHAPSFGTDSELDRVVKDEVLRDTLSLLNFSPEARRQKKREAREKMDQRAIGVAKRQTLAERQAQQQEVALRRTAWEDANLNGYKRLYPSEEKEKEYLHFHDASIGIWENLMGGHSRRSVRLTQPPPEVEPSQTPTDGKKPPGQRKPKATAAADGESAETNPRRTAEEIREAVHRMSAGCSARPLRNESLRSSVAASSSAEIPMRDTLASQDGEDRPWTEEQDKEERGYLLPMQLELYAGDVIKVQTNMGWEAVTVKALRKSGKLDIKFEDGEYMRAVMPRICRSSLLILSGNRLRDAPQKDAGVTTSSPYSNLAGAQKFLAKKATVDAGARKDTPSKPSDGAGEQGGSGVGAEALAALDVRFPPEYGSPHRSRTQRDSKSEDRFEPVCPPLFVNGRSGAGRRGSRSPGPCELPPAAAWPTTGGEPAAESAPAPEGTASPIGAAIAARLQNQATVQQLVNARLLNVRREADASAAKKFVQLRLGSSVAGGASLSEKDPRQIQGSCFQLRGQPVCKWDVGNPPLLVTDKPLCG